MSSLGDSIYSVNKSKLNSTPMKDLGTARMKELEDLSPLIVDFVQQDKSIFLLDSGTGFGKSYSLNSFIHKCITNRELFEKVNKIFYITDRRHNVEQEYRDFIDRFPSEKDLVLPIKSNLDCIATIDKDVLKKLPNKFKDLAEYKSLKMAKEDYRPGNENSEKQLINEELAFRKKVKDVLFKDYPTFSSLSYQEKIEFLKTDKELCNLLKLYPSILTKSKKIIYLTIDKFFLPFDTILDKDTPYLYESKTFMENSIILFDESDAMAKRILDKIVEQSSKYPVDIIEKTETIYAALSSKKLTKNMGKDNKDINTAIDNALKKYEDIKEKFYLNYSITFEGADNTRWLFSKQDSNILYKAKKQEEQYIELDPVTNQALIKNKEEVVGEVTPDLEYGKFVLNCVSVLNDFYRVINKIAKNYRKESDILGETEESSIKKVLDYFRVTDFSSNSDSLKNKALIKSISLMPQTDSRSGENSDFYLHPGELIKTELPEDRDIIIKLISHQLSLTPEKFLKTIIDKKAKIILSSATSTNKSLLRNFNLNWKYIKDEIFATSPHAQEIEAEYYNKQEKNKDNVNIVVNKIAQKIDEKKILSLINENKSFAENYLKMIAFAAGEYYKDIYFEVIWDILNKLENNVSASLFFLKFSLVNKTDKGAPEFKSFLNNVIKKEHPDFRPFFAEADNIKKEIDCFKSAAGENKQCFLITTYETAEKGLNLKIRRPVKSSDVVILNDFGEKEFDNNLDKNSMLSDVEVDLDGIYLGDITYIYPSIASIKSKGGVGDYTASILTAAYYIQSMYYENEITDKELQNTMSDILASTGIKENNSCFSKNISEYSYKKSFIFKIVSALIQAIGRKCRCNIKAKNNFITLNYDLCNKITRSDRSILEEDLLKKQSFEIKKVFEAVVPNSSCSGEKLIYRKAILERKNEDVEVALKENRKGNPSKLKKIHSITRYSFSLPEYFKEEVGSVPMELYFETPEELVGKTGYTCNTNNGKDFFSICHPLTPGKKEVSIDALGLTSEQKDFLESQGISFSTNGYKSKNAKILTPLGFDVFAGRIGEILGRHILQEELPGFGLSKLKELPDPIYERMDDYIIYDNGIFVIDYKYWKEPSSDNDDIETYLDKYEKKLLEIKEYFDSSTGKERPILGIEIVIRNNETAIPPKTLVRHSFKSEKLKDFPFLCIPSIYNEDTSKNFELFQQLKEYLKKLI